MKKIELDEYKVIVKNMLAYVHSFCVENNIRYFVGYGTLIGTIRHEGFIPWDDDIDIWMLGEDYERFVELFTKSTQEYYILSAKSSPTYFNAMTRICSKVGTLKMKGMTDVENLGPFIDVFPIYKAPEDKEERMAFFREIKEANLDLMYSMPLRCFRTRTLKGRLAACAEIVKRRKQRRKGPEALKKERDELFHRYENTDTNRYYAVFETKVNDKRIFTREELEKVELHRFEDIEVLIPSAYDAILRRIYGDYMQYPPVEEQVTHHHFTPYWKDEE